MNYYLIKYKASDYTDFTETYEKLVKANNFDEAVRKLKDLHKYKGVQPVLYFEVIENKTI